MNYLSTQDLSKDAMFKMTQIILELIPDPDMHLFFEKGTRGGISDIWNKYSKVKSTMNI